MTATAPEGNLRGAAVAAVAASAAAAAGYHEGTKRLPRGTAGLEEFADAQNVFLGFVMMSLADINSNNTDHDIA